MKLENFFTDYDDSVAGEIKIDPLGMLAIWSSLGQRIFNNRVSSISNDVRNYTLNLLHHHAIRNLVNDATRPLPVSLAKQFESKDSLAFKQACILLLEDVFVLTVVENEGLSEPAKFDPIGILGITRARRARDDANGSLNEYRLQFSTEANRFLTNQLSLGVSGRYKTPLIEMSFFDKRYEYRLPAFNPQWVQFENFLAASNKKLLALSSDLTSFLYEAIQRTAKGRTTHFKDVPDELKTGYLKQFSTPGTVGSYSRNFWLAITGLDLGAAGAILTVLEKTLPANGEAIPVSNKNVIEQALQTAPEAHKHDLERITQIEPFLANIDLLFWCVLSKQSQTVADVESSWRVLLRDETTLPRMASELMIHGNTLTDGLSALAKARLTKLLAFASISGFDKQLEFLIKYHHKIMENRGQGEWSVIESNGKIRNYVRKDINLAPLKWPPGVWTHTYYIPEFRQLSRGLSGGRL